MLYNTIGLDASTTPATARWIRLLHELAETFGAAIDAKDHHTRDHSDDVANLASCLAERMSCSRPFLEIIHLAGHLHDIGKLGIPDAILLKPGPLNPEEWTVIRRHPEIGADILSKIKSVKGIEDITRMVSQHHERWDGQGYPFGSEAEDIHPGARIIAVADSISAIMQNRPYRPAATFDEAVAEINRCSGTRYDPAVTRVLIDNAEDIRNQWLSRGARAFGARPALVASRTSGTFALPR